MTSAQPAAVIVLAAGEGTRMKSATPKVLHTLAGRSMVGHALAAAQGLNPERIAVVVRFERDKVAHHVLEILPDAVIVDQDDVPGTGRAVQCAVSVLDATIHAAEAAANSGSTQNPLPLSDGLSGPVVVVSGDVPMLDAETLAELLDAHVTDGNAVTVLTTELRDATGYGRIVREGDGSVAGIVEHKDATPEQLEIREINSGTYVFDSAVLRRALGSVDRNNAQGEVYLTDVLALARAEGGAVRAVRTDDPWLVEGANDRAQMSVLRAEFNRRITEFWMKEGVTIVDPATTWIDVQVELEQDVTILPGTQLFGETVVRTGAVVGPDTTLENVVIESNATVTRTHGSDSRIGESATVGPFAYLRPGTELGVKGKIGTFVETKNAKIGNGSKVPHLSYAGDVEVGEATNIGAGSIFVNYDGVNKHRSTVGSFSRTGANNLFIAPVHIGDGVYTGAGTVLRKDVPAGNLAVSAGAQRNIEGWVERRRPETDSARAAAKARELNLTAQNTLGAQARAELARAESPKAAPVPNGNGNANQSYTVPETSTPSEGNID
ncbi:bifunctional UDP-N-acetylglucosamine diphosphorylase/glucosamine-1-phosphate N-acetyltransferase GlmU [Timonella senegalensis]|uniref:bifunctional UDP-N-acetylglucosamine diphosphorylase/glucosamine-1-phosphate N-acetyltransferase GlmU n=2 Tax=Timonella senegalensis TaxID=1465825 RepID=UPI0028AFB7CB|nr:bifunctional UDP-N-acetylglucosamine diphosphorylase/glucosamine-1-phosphate N-acetyltransferase GlmU [Timonella senegalensis]